GPAPERGEATGARFLTHPGKRSSFFSRSVELDAVGVADALPAEDVEGAPDGQVHPAARERLDPLEVVQRARATSVSHRNWGIFGEQPDERLVDALALPLHVGGVDEELRRVVCEAVEELPIDRRRGD